MDVDSFNIAVLKDLMRQADPSNHRDILCIHMETLWNYKEF